MGENNGVGAALTAPNHIDGIGGAEDMTTPISKRTTSPAFQFYPDAFLSSTKVIAMSMTERGIYITLLCACWMDGSLPADMKSLARMVGMKETQFAKLWPHNIARCFYEDAGRLVNGRIEVERRKQAEFRRRQTDNGTKGGRPKKPMGSFEETHSKARANREREEDVLQVASSSSEGSLRGTPPMDTWARELVSQYPAQGRCGWNLVERPLYAALMADATMTPWQAWESLKTRLESHKRSHQWLVKRMIPRVDRWLQDGLYNAELPEDAPVVASAGKALPDWVQRVQDAKRSAAQS